MSLYMRSYSDKKGAKPVWWIDVQWKGYDRIRQSAHTHKKGAAQALLGTLKQLKSAGRRDLLGLIAAKRIDLLNLHATLLLDPGAINHMSAAAPSPPLGVLVEEWLIWLSSPGGISPRTGRRYTSQTIRRYEVSWNGFFEALTMGRDTLLSEITSGALAEYRQARVKGGCSGQTVNRDLCAMQSLLRWAREDKELSFATPAFKKVKESQGRERWLNATEIEVVRSVAPEEWWPFFALLIYTGIRVGEAQGLRWGDIQFIDRKIAIHTLHRGLKTPTSDRGVPIPEPLAVLIAAHATRFPADPTKPVFPGRMGNYWTALGTWRKIVAASGIAYCVMHDLRHTFGVHAARAGVPLARLQKLMGHAHPHMTLRYMRHVPDGDFAKDAASVAQSMVDRSGAEGDARAVVARSRLGVA